MRHIVTDPADVLWTERIAEGVFVQKLSDSLYSVTTSAAVPKRSKVSFCLHPSFQGNVELMIDDPLYENCPSHIIRAVHDLIERDAVKLPRRRH